MRSLIAVTLLLTPALLHAQNASPAQPTFTSSLSAPTVPAGVSKKVAAPASDASASVRISTGVVAPRLIHTVEITSSDATASPFHADKKIVLNMIVDETGKTSNLQVVESAGSLTDRTVLAAVSQYRYQPATLDGQPVAIPVRLQVLLQHGVSQ